MNWDAVGAIGEVFGGLIVIVSVLYLAIQLKQNNRISISEFGNRTLSEDNRCLELILTSPQIVPLLHKFQTGETLDPEDEIRADVFAERLINNWLVAEISHQQQAFDPTFYEEIVCQANRYFDRYPPLRGYCLGVLKHFPQLSEMELYKAIFEELRTS